MSSEPFSIKSLNILLVEDDPLTQSTMAQLLTTHNHTVRRAAGVESALAALAESPCEVLISDIGLPDGTGWYLLERAGIALCPYAIAISGFDSTVDLADSAAAGFRHHFVKPVDPADLIAALEEAAATLTLPPRVPS